MPNVKQVEAQIKGLEKFKVTIRHGLSRRNVRDDLGKLPSYKTKYKRGARERFSVSDWKSKRFRKHYPGFVVDVVRANGRRADGKMRLATVCEEYLQEA